jgi:hypothetical protein
MEMLYRNRLAVLLALPIALLSFGCSDDDDPLTPGAGQAFLRVAHLSPDAPDVDIWVDGSVVLQNLPFSAISDYLSVDAGSRRIQVTPAGATQPVVIDADVSLTSGLAYTVAATGLLMSGDLAPLPLIDDRDPVAGSAKVRFVHTSPDAPAVDVAAKGGPVLFANVSFREGSVYLPVAPGTYDLEVRLAGTMTVALEVPGVALSGGTNYSIFAIGKVMDGTLSALPSVDS